MSVTLASPFSALASEIEARPPLAVEEVPETKSGRHLYWMIGALCALTIGVAEVGILMLGTPNAQPVSSAAPPAGEGDACARRVAALMEGIAAYTTRTGRAPATLDALYPDFIGFEPIDPAVNEPYGYEVLGQAVSITCPSAASGAGAAPGA